MLVPNVSKIPMKSFVGRALRFPLRFIPKETVLPIFQGRLRGKRWVTGSFNHGCWLGTYELEKQSRFEQKVSNGAIVYDIGAHVGYYTLMASELVGDGGKVYAFEPSPENRKYLYRHIEINRCFNVEVWEAAVSDKSGDFSFHKDGDFNTESRLHPEGDTTVSVICLDDLVKQEKIAIADVIKIDVEGEELNVLKGAQEILANNSPILFLATHNQVVHQECCAWLRALGYVLESLYDNDVESTDELIAYRR